MKIYCPHCGFPAQYKLIKPETCSNCNVSLTNKNQTKNKIVPLTEKDYEDENAILSNSLCDPKDFKVNIKKFEESKVTIGDVVVGSYEPVERQIKSKKMSKAQKKQILNNFSEKIRKVSNLSIGDDK
ncbi:MAG: hypothetical protein HC836_12650 [Richelia sp. RM2_1_2]|nr:hypothetical protein [Richelia sp. RM2_1_2]